MAPLIWPSILVPSSESWNVNRGASRSGGRSLANQEQVVVGPSGFVTATLTVPCNKPAKVLAMRALLAGLDGRAGTVLVGPFEVARAPWFVDPLTGGKITTCRGDQDAALDAAWDANADTSADLDFRAAGAIAMNATALTVKRNRGGLLAPGMFFEIASRLHMITALTTADPTGDGGLAAPGNIGIQFRPWTRADYPANTAIELGHPRCTMRLASDDTGAMELQLSRYGSVTLDLVEAF
jgi:hypothetical protein